MHRRRASSTSGGLIGVVGSILIVASCTSASAPAGASRSPGVATASSETPMSSPGAETQPPGPVEDLLVVRNDDGARSDGYTVIEARTGQVVFKLPRGAISGDWHTLVGLVAGTAATTVRVAEAEGGQLRREIQLPGAWRLPTIGITRTPGGLSADGNTLVLEDEAPTGGSAASAQTRFAIVPTDGSADPRIVTLKGSFIYDALSPDGRWLYLIEHLAGGDPNHYAVRRLDVASGRLEDGSIVDKRNVDEVMSGYAVTQLTGRLGWVYTLYRGHNGAFIHALSTNDGVAFCIDLPGTTGSNEATAAGWGLALSPTRDELFAANGTLRVMSDIDLSSFGVSRTSTLASAPSIELAKFESAEPAGGGLALSQDGATLFALVQRGVTVVRASDLATIGHLGGDRTYLSVAAGSGGAVYAVRDDGRAVVLGKDSEPSLVFVGDHYVGIAAVVPLR
jgi:hypothetical protein